MAKTENNFARFYPQVKLSMWNVTVVGIQDIELDRYIYMISLYVLSYFIFDFDECTKHVFSQTHTEERSWPEQPEVFFWHILIWK